MTINRRVGFGNTLGVDSTGGTSFVTLGAVIDGWKGPGAKKEAIDISVLSDADKQFGVGQKDWGEVTFSIMYDPDETTTTTLETLFNSVSQVAANWRVTYGTGSTGSGTIKTRTFLGHVVGLSPEVKVNEHLMCEVTVKVSGAVA